MRLSFYALFESLALLAISIFWCEFGYYYFVFYFNCSGWPEPENFAEDATKLTRMLVLADTHIMGPIKSVRIDKIRREWQMKQAFIISNSIFQPDVVLFLGDIFDEASFSRDEAFDKFGDEFERIFPVENSTRRRIIIPGNHDVGFHDQMIHYPHLIKRFEDKYLATSTVELARSSYLEGLNLIVVNSMSFYNDTCPFCSASIASTNRLGSDLDSLRRSKPNEYSAPILLTHIPLYRPDDSLCDYPARLEEKVKKKNMEGEEVMHSGPSKFLLNKFNPRLVLSGHTHMNCLTDHYISDSQKPIRELTISSYNHKYAEKKPNFLLVSANRTHVFTTQCNLIEEWVIASIYIATILLICTRIAILNKDKPRKNSLLKQ